MATFDIERIYSSPLHTYLTSGETYTREQLLAAGLTEDQIGNKFLIGIKDDGGVVHYLKFQFDHNDSGQPTGLNETVMAVNELTGADTEPLGIGDWWTGDNAWIPGHKNHPVDHLGSWPKDTYVSFLNSTMLSDD